MNDKNKVILITGANGYIANYLIKTLNKNTCIFIYAVVRKKHKGNFKDSSNVKYIYIDMEEYENLNSIINIKIDCIINCAWDGIRGKRNHETSVQSENIQGVIGLLNFAEKSECRKFIQLGSLAEYGETMQHFPVSEKMKCIPITSYAKAKYDSYIKLRDACQQLHIQFCELRIGSVYGPHMQKNTLIQQIITGLKENNNVELLSDCEQLWEFIHIKDIVAIFEKIIVFMDNIDYTIINLSSGERKKLKEFIREIESLIHGNGTVILGTAGKSQFGCECIQCDTSLLKNILGENYRFILFKDGIREMIAMEQTN